MENGCEYYLAGEVRLCIEQAARQMTESNSVYKELDSIINHQKFRRCIAMAKYCNASMAYFGEFYDDASKRMVDHYYKWRERWYKIADNFRRKPWQKMKSLLEAL